MFGSVGNGITDDTDMFRAAWDMPARTIMLPDGPDLWSQNNSKQQWLVFYKINEISLQGSGLIDGRGEKWWNLPCKPHKGVNSTALPGPSDSPIEPMMSGAHPCISPAVTLPLYQHNSVRSIAPPSSRRFSVGPVLLECIWRFADANNSTGVMLVGEISSFDPGK
ncbi:pectin lyase-like superfamily protein [Actinidia rufa]|uniref:Pectin lyase-like superfamily protein n=1 Tax=Actinidia rufa TaxID=165716 RepID=A0A7J0H8Q1_9ERIC|nr:pectin lyase-like superfamily protein [Actinidia rufa]